MTGEQAWHSILWFSVTEDGKTQTDWNGIFFQNMRKKPSKGKTGKTGIMTFRTNKIGKPIRTGTRSLVN
jgi:hypothetical protein